MDEAKKEPTSRWKTAKTETTEVLAGTHLIILVRPWLGLWGSLWGSGGKGGNPSLFYYSTILTSAFWELQYSIDATVEDEPLSQ